MASGDVILDVTTQAHNGAKDVVQSGNIELSDGTKFQYGWEADWYADTQTEVIVRRAVGSGATVDRDAPVQRDKAYRIVITEV